MIDEPIQHHRFGNIDVHLIDYSKNNSDTSRFNDWTPSLTEKKPFP